MNSLNRNILIATTLAVVSGMIMNYFEMNNEGNSFLIELLDLVGNLFIQLLKMIMIPLLFFSLTTSIAGLGSHKNSQKIWKNVLLYYLVTMVIAIVFTVLIFNIFQPGKDSEISFITSNNPLFENTQNNSIKTVILSFFENPFSALANNNILAIILSAILIGIALTSKDKKTAIIISFLEGCYDVVMQITMMVMKIAPIGIFGLLTTLIINQELSIFANLFSFIIFVLGATLFHGLVILPSILFFITKIRPMDLWIKCKEVFLTAFSTSSSAATLPFTMHALEKNFNIKKNISKFVLPLGATVNMDGTALYEAAAAMFIANLVGIDLSIIQQLILVVLAMSASIGAPAIPSAGMVTLALVLSTLNLPVEYIALLLPIDRLLDTFRTTVNVEGDIVGALIVDKLAKR